MGRAKKIESGVTAAKPAPKRGGYREGSGRKPNKRPLKMITFKWPLQAIKECARFARARGVARNKAAHIMIEEYAAWLNDPKRLFTWGGEQVLIPPPSGNTR